MYALMYTILYRGLEHPQILVSTRVLEPIPLRYQETTKFLGNQKIYSDFQVCQELVPLTFMLFKGQLYYKLDVNKFSLFFKSYEIRYKNKIQNSIKASNLREKLKIKEKTFWQIQHTHKKRWYSNFNQIKQYYGNINKGVMIYSNKNINKLQKSQNHIHTSLLI